MRKRILILGGSGFIGSYVVKELAKSGHILEIFARDKQNADRLKIYGQLGQITTIEGEIQNSIQLINILENGHIDIVINLVGILNASANASYININLKAAVEVAKITKKLGIQLIHFSALVNNDKTEYSRTKRAAAIEIANIYPQSIIIKPSVVFGAEDCFFNLFAKVITRFSIFPLIGKGKTLLQPVYVGDIAIFIKYLITQDKVFSNNCVLVGPKVYSLKDIINFICQTINRKCFLINLPFNIAKVLAFILENFPGKLFNKLFLLGRYEPILTCAQVEELKYDSISQISSLSDYGILPTSLEDVVPSYLKIYKKI